MARPKFFHDDDFIEGSEVILSQTESKHAAGARRLRIGDDVILLNGRGDKAFAKLLDTSNRNAIVVDILSVDHLPKPQYRLEIATAIPKGDRQKVLLDMLTQIGVTHITPLECEYSVTHFKQSSLQRWHRGVIESCKQCERPWLPVIGESKSLEHLLESKDQRLLLYCDVNGQHVHTLSELDNADVTVLIGPEGGFSANEMDLLSKNGIHPISLANNILRTEAAAIIAASQLINLI